MSSLNIDSFFLYSVFKEQLRLLTCSHLKPLLFRRNLSHRMSASFFFLIRQPPTLPYRLQHSTIGRLSLNLRVRHGYGCLP